MNLSLRVLLVALTITSASVISSKKRPEAFKMFPQNENSSCSMHCDQGSLYISGDWCTNIPTEIPHGISALSITALYISATRLTTMKAGDLNLWAGVKAITIEMNNELETIESGTFAWFSELENLTISGNYALSSMDVNVFEGLFKLRFLSLARNAFSSLMSVTALADPAKVPNLFHLDLSGNYFDAVLPSDFYPMMGSSLQYLQLEECSLSSADPNGLAPLTSLVGLNLGYNYLMPDQISQLVLHLVRTAPNFTKLSVSGNLFEKDPGRFLRTLSKTRISVINLRDNRFEQIEANEFPRMPNLVSLDLSNTQALSVSSEIFTDELLPKLEHFYLSNNRFMGPLYFSDMTNLIELDLSGSLSPFTIGNLGLQNLTNLEVLNLSQNVIHILRQMDFGQLKKLEYLYLSNCSLYSIEPNSFQNLNFLVYLDLSQNELFSQKFTSGTFYGLTSLETLKLESNGIETFSTDTFTSTPNLKYLHLSGNALVDIDPQLLKPLTCLVRLDLSYNNLGKWTERLLTTNSNLKNLSLTSNQIGDFTLAMLLDLDSVENVSVAGNPLTCECQSVVAFAEFYSLTGQLNPPFNDSSTLMCSVLRSTRFQNYMHYITTELNSDVCLAFFPVVLTVSLCVGGFLVLVVVSIVGYYLRWHIRYWVFLVKQALQFNYFPEPKNPSNGTYKYDAFVSYSNEDRNFVVRLVAMLENVPPYLKLCVFERDFNIGGIIADNVVESLSNSRRTILILSDSFARSTWCIWEMKMAQHHRHFFRDDRNEPLIIIKIGEIMDKHMTPTLKYLIKTRIYLQWNSDPKKQKMFWRKLRNALSTPLATEIDSKAPVKV